MAMFGSRVIVNKFARNFMGISRQGVCQDLMSHLKSLLRIPGDLFNSKRNCRMLSTETPTVGSLLGFVHHCMGSVSVPKGNICYLGPIGTFMSALRRPDGHIGSSGILYSSFKASAF